MKLLKFSYVHIDSPTLTLPTATTTDLTEQGCTDGI